MDTFYAVPGCPLNIPCTFYLHPVSWVGAWILEVSLTVSLFCQQKWLSDILKQSHSDPNWNRKTDDQNHIVNASHVIFVTAAVS